MWREDPGSPRRTSTTTTTARHNNNRRRDDVESLCYMLIHLRTGALPWSGVCADGTKRERFGAMLRMKETTPLRELSAEMPDGFADLLGACRAMRCGETPEYERMRDVIDAWR